MSGAALRLGSRGSALALAQTALVARALEERGRAVEVVTVRTSGDRAQADRTLALERGAFVGALERALLAGEIDVAVHSAKDLPVGFGTAAEIVAFLPRADPRDALVSRDGGNLAALPHRSRVGTESPRRRAFLLRARPDLDVIPIRGNVDTRLARLDAGDVEALVLAAAGLERLGRAGLIAERLSPETMLPAVGQGALAVQARADDPRASVLRALDDGPTRAAVLAERRFLHAMGGGCRAPYAALGRVAGGRLTLHGAAVSPDGADVARRAEEGPVKDAELLGERLARALLERGAGRLAGRA